MTEHLLALWNALYSSDSVRKRKTDELTRDLQFRQIEGERRLRILRKRAELHTN